MKCNCKNNDIIVTSSGLIDGLWKPQYGSASNIKLGNMPLISIPLKWNSFPSNTKSFAISVIDYDTVPIIGFPWIHWLSANIDVKFNSIPENASILCSNFMIQGLNSFSDSYLIDLKELDSFKVPKEYACRYGGFAPIEFPHKYTVTVYALDSMLNLSNGFTYNIFLDKIKNHVLSKGYLYGVYDHNVIKI